MTLIASLTARQTESHRPGDRIDPLSQAGFVATRAIMQESSQSTNFDWVAGVYAPPAKLDQENCKIC
jgi:hypothetical protein